MFAICWSYQPPPTSLWFPGNHTCLRLVTLLSSSRSQSAGRKAALGSSSDKAWNAFSTLLETWVLVNFHWSADPRMPNRGTGGIPSEPTVSQTATALILISVELSRYVSRVHDFCALVSLEVWRNAL